MINYGKQTIESMDISAVSDVLNSDWLTQGPKVSEFESALAEYCGATFAVVVSNGTAALHLANLVISEEKNSTVLTTPNSFLATSNSIIYAGNHPGFIDIDKESFTIDPGKIEEYIELNPEKNISGIIPVHFGGVVSEMDRIFEIAKKNNLKVIEDACHALGGNWQDNKGKNQTVGNCSHSDMTIFSFHPVKQMTTGEGGAILTNNQKLYNKLIELRSHGMTKDPMLMQEYHGEWYYEMHDLGFNYRITDIQAAIGIEQLKRMENWKKERREIVRNYDDAFECINGISHQKHPDINGEYSYHLYVIQSERRDELYSYLKKNDVNTQVHYIPIHLQPYYRNKFGYKTGDFPNAESYYKKALSLPLYPGLKKIEQEKVINLVKKFHA